MNISTTDGTIFVMDRREYENKPIMYRHEPLFLKWNDARTEKLKHFTVN